MHFFSRIISYIRIYLIIASNAGRRGQGVMRGCEFRTRKMEIGIITRLLAPLRLFYLKNVTDRQKDPLFSSFLIRGD